MREPRDPSRNFILVGPCPAHCFTRPLPFGIAGAQFQGIENPELILRNGIRGSSRKFAVNLYAADKQKAAHPGSSGSFQKVIHSNDVWLESANRIGREIFRAGQAGGVNNVVDPLIGGQFQRTRNILQDEL